MRYCACFMLFCILFAISCGDGTPSSPATSGSTPVTGTYPERGVVHWKSFLDWDSGTIAEAARSKLMITPVSWCFSPESRGALDELKARKPDIKIIGYHAVLGVTEMWPDTGYVRTVLPFDFDFYEAVLDDWAYTTTGDTLMIWPDVIFLNPIRNGDINVSLIHEIVGLIERYQIESGGVLDGIMHDYFMHNPHISIYVEDRVNGGIDFDGNGIVILEDDNEQDLFIRWQKEYVREFRTRFGADFIQVGNGRLPQDDPEMAHLLNGIFYESFPHNPWNFTDRDGFMRLLSHQEDGYLSTACGRTWSILTNVGGRDNNTFCLVASMLAGCFYTELYGRYIFTGWTLTTDAGHPTGPTTVEGSTDSLLTYRREFMHGDALISFYPNGTRKAVLYTPRREHAR